MASRKRTTLPTDFNDIVATGDLAAMRAVFEKCEVDARGGYAKSTALSTYAVPEEMVRWLVEAGADIEAADTYGETALHDHARAWNGSPGLLLDLGADLEARDSRGCTPLHHAALHPAHVEVLLDRGADVLALDEQGRTPLARALARARNIDIARLVAPMRILLAAGDTLTDGMRADVDRLGKEFEEVRVGFESESVDETAAGLEQLYAIAQVAPAPARIMHDGASPILVAGDTTAERFDNLWEALVPASGAAATVQGEALRIVGRLSKEILGNGSANWDKEFRAMTDALPDYLGLGVALDRDGLREASRLAKTLRRGRFDEPAIARLRELAVEWVSNNPHPLALPTPRYRR